MEVKKYNSSYKKIWDEFVKTSKNGLFMFHRNYMEYHADRYKDHSLLFFEKDKLLALLPLSEHGTTLISHGGLTFGGFVTGLDMKQHKMNSLFCCLRKYMEANSFRYLIYKVVPHFYHQYAAEEDIYELFRANAEIIKIEAATVCAFEQPIKLPKGRKAQISRAKREGVQIEESLDYKAFIAVENEVLEKYHGTQAVHTGKELEVLHNNFPNNIKLYVARIEGEIVAGTVLYIYSNGVHTQYLCANDIARKVGALDYTIAYVMELYKNSKKWFDFGKSTEGDGMMLNSGLISQKEGFGGRTVIYQTWGLRL